MSLEAMRVLNIGIESFALLTDVVLIVGMFHEAAMAKRRLLILSIWLHLVSTLGGLVGFCCVGHPGALAYYALATGCYFSFGFNILTRVVVAAYIYADEFGKPLIDKNTGLLARVITMINMLDLAFVAINPLTHAYYSFGPNSTLLWGPFIYVHFVLSCAQITLMMPLALKMNVQRNARTALRLMLCGVLALATTLVDTIWPGIFAMPMAASLVLMLLGVGVQSRVEEDLVRARADAAESRVRLLSGQIHPHFIFNSLNAIKALVSEDPDLAERTIQDFSDYLRSHLDVMSSSRLVPFEQELDHVRHYVSLEMADPVCPLQVTYDLQVEEFSVPPLTVQPLVENAIRHGILTREEGGTVQVMTRERDDVFVVTISDDGRGISSATERQDQQSRVGIENVRERLERQCRGTLEVCSGSQGTVATMTLPKARKEGGQS